MRCPKCGSRHIVDGMCVMCGAIVFSVEYVAEKVCLACGRRQRFEGHVCRDCADAIAKGAVTLKQTAKRNINATQEMAFALCPCIAPLEEIYAQSRANKAKKAAQKRAWAAANPEKVAVMRKREKQKNAENREEYNRRRRENEAYQAWRREYKKRPEVREKCREYQMKYRSNPEVRARLRAQDREYQRQKREAFKRLPLEEQERIKAEYKASPAGIRDRQRDTERAKRRWTDPVQRERMRENNRRYEQSEKGKAARARARERRREIMRLIRDNEALQREREVAAQYEQWEASGAEDRRNQGAVRGDSLRGDNTGESQLGVVVNGRVCAAEGSSMVENGPV